MPTLAVGELCRHREDSTRDRISEIEASRQESYNRAKSLQRHHHHSASCFPMLHLSNKTAFILSTDVCESAMGFAVDYSNVPTVLQGHACNPMFQLVRATISMRFPAPKTAGKRFDQPSCCSWLGLRKATWTSTRV